jgi:hypothetical protein
MAPTKADRGLPVCSPAPMNGAEDGDGGMEAAMCSSAATSSTLDDDIGAGCRGVARRLFTSADGAQDDEGDAEVAGMYTGVSSLPRMTPKTTTFARRAARRQPLLPSRMMPA